MNSVFNTVQYQLFMVDTVLNQDIPTATILTDVFVHYLMQLLK